MPADYAPMADGSTGRLYQRAPQNLVWTGQRDLCASISANAYIAVPGNATELAGLALLAGTTPFWVGLHQDAVEGTYVTVRGGTATFLPWAAGEPDNQGGGSQNCLAATATTISDEDCSVAIRPAVCECEP